MSEIQGAGSRLQPADRKGWVRALAAKKADGAYYARAACWALLAAGLTHAAWAALAPAGANGLALAMASGKGLLLVIALLVAHELIHLVSYPRVPGSRRRAGFDARRLTFYVSYHGPITKQRRIFCAILPFVVLSFGSLLLAVITGSESPELAYVAFWNSIISGSDLDNSARFARSIPADAHLMQDETGLWIREGTSKRASRAG